MVNKIYKTKFKMNKAKDIQEGNKLIAEFMKEENISAIFQTEPFVTEVRISYNMINELEKQGAEVRLYYHDNWNKLMPVVEKIEGLEKKRFGFHIDPHDIAIVDYKTSDENGVIFSTREECSFMESMYEAVIQFIKWYNQNKTS